MNDIATTCIFLLTYLLLSWPRCRLLPVGRPAAALIGAALMVATRALSPAPGDAV